MVKLDDYDIRMVETLVDHVTDPNGEGSAQRTVICANAACKALGLVFYDEEGDLYVENYEAFNVLSNTDRKELHKGALGSHARDYSNKLDYEKCHTYKLPLPIYRKKGEIKYRAMLEFKFFDHWSISLWYPHWRGTIYSNPKYNSQYNALNSKVRRECNANLS
jgi:hypothetical protein